VQPVLAQDLLDLVEAGAGRAGLDADPVGFFSAGPVSTAMRIGMREVFAPAFCFCVGS